jgi:magnesium-transporting ATPase (P-type)
MESTNYKSVELTDGNNHKHDEVEAPVFEGHPVNGIISKDELEYLCKPNISIPNVLQRLSTEVSSGLEGAEANRRLALYGSNELMKQKKIPLWLLFLSQFANLIIIILLTAAVVSIIVGELVEGVAVIVIVLITATMATYTEHSSSNALEALAQLTDPHSHVYRDGRVQVIRTCELVPGDIVQLSPGDLVRATVHLATVPTSPFIWHSSMLPKLPV